MTSFFGRFRGWIRDNMGGDPGGRYFAILLAESFGEQPGAVSEVLFPRRRNLAAVRAVPEYAYDDGRRADLGLFASDDKLVGLVEVKEDDQLVQGAANQLADYLSYAKKENVPFAYVTRHTPSEACMSLLRAHGQRPVYYSDLYRALELQTSPICQLFCKYLEEIGPVYKQLTPDDSDALRLLMRQVFAVGGAGPGQQGAFNAANVLLRLVSNVEALGIDFYRQYRHFFKIGFTPAFSFTRTGTDSRQQIT
ncbi:MAG: PD-(D/E)XK nuclease family protein [Pseudomonadota bacterium]|nr:PD-(D/E)XK nuclease family protein [Pseudomonadota bacterium]